MVTENDLADAVQKLETDCNQRDARAAEQREQELQRATEKAQNGHNDPVPAKPTASHALN
jgi:hypothetical protein